VSGYVRIIAGLDIDVSARAALMELFACASEGPYPVKQLSGGR
jgi:hypothetical protein